MKFVIFIAVLGQLSMLFTSCETTEIACRVADVAGDWQVESITTELDLTGQVISVLRIPLRLISNWTKLPSLIQILNKL